MAISPDALYALLCNDIDSAGPLTGTRAYAASALLNSFLKKRQDISSMKADEKAIETWHASNDKCRSYCYSLPEESVDHFIDSSVKHYLDRFSITFPKDLDMYEYGPGASAYVKGTSFYTKCMGDVSMTSINIYKRYCSLIAQHPLWSSVELDRLKSATYKVVDGSRLCCVPKNDKISRSICVEPSLNMFLQKGLGKMLENALGEVYHIDLSDQQFRNRDLARKGSRDQSFSTIDLKSASDSISLAWCAEFLPSVLYESLMACRSPFCEVEGVQHEQFMIGSQGNSNTFPLQTIIFCSVVHAVYSAYGIDLVLNKGSFTGNFGVYGDDIICLNRTYQLICKTLVRYGFSINGDKSFTGYSRFRESCGGDYYDGYNVRPVFLHSLETQQDRSSLFNRLSVWSCRHAIDLSSVLLELSSGLPRVPLWFPENSGIRSKAPVGRFTNGTVLYKFQALSSSVSRFNADCEDGGLFQKRIGAIRSPNGLFLSLLQGSLRNGRMDLLYGSKRCNKRHMYTTVWYACDRSSPFLEDVTDESYISFITEERYSSQATA